MTSIAREREREREQGEPASDYGMKARSAHSAQPADLLETRPLAVITFYGVVGSYLLVRLPSFILFFILFLCVIRLLSRNTGHTVLLRKISHSQPTSFSRVSNPPMSSLATPETPPGMSTKTHRYYEPSSAEASVDEQRDERGAGVEGGDTPLARRVQNLLGAEEW